MPCAPATRSCCGSRHVASGARRSCSRCSRRPTPSSSKPTSSSWVAPANSPSGWSNGCTGLFAAGPHAPGDWLASEPWPHQNHLRLGQHDPGPEGLTDRRARGPPHAPVARRDRRDGAPDSGSRPGPAHGPRRRAGTDRDELHPSASRWHGHGHAASGGRPGLARLRVVLSGNARTPRVADRGPGRAEAG